MEIKTPIYLRQPLQFKHYQCRNLNHTRILVMLKLEPEANGQCLPTIATLCNLQPTNGGILITQKISEAGSKPSLWVFTRFRARLLVAAFGPWWRFLGWLICTFKKRCWIPSCLFLFFGLNQFISGVADSFEKCTGLLKMSLSYEHRRKQD